MPGRQWQARNRETEETLVSVELTERPTAELLDELRELRGDIQSGDAARVRRDEVLAVLIQRPRKDVPIEDLIEATGLRRAMVYMARKFAGQREERSAR
jgi:hypothetical protein